MKNFSTRHTRDTAAPQTYWSHGKVAITKSAKLVWFGLAGIVHGVLPEIKGLQFYTSSGILRAAFFLLMSRRHDAEIRRIFGLHIAEQMFFEREYQKKKHPGWKYG